MKKRIRDFLDIVSLRLDELSPVEDLKKDILEDIGGELESFEILVREDRKTLQIIGMPLGLRVKVSFVEDKDSQLSEFYSTEKMSRAHNGNLTFLVPYDITKITIAMHYCGIDYAMVGHKLEETIVTRIFFDEWTKDHAKKKAWLDGLNSKNYPRKCEHCDTMLENVNEYEIHQCPPQEE